MVEPEGIEPNRQPPCILRQGIYSPPQGTGSTKDSTLAARLFERVRGANASVLSLELTQLIVNEQLLLFCSVCIYCSVYAGACQLLYMFFVDRPGVEPGGSRRLIHLHPGAREDSNLYSFPLQPIFKHTTQYPELPPFGLRPAQ